MLRSGRQVLDWILKRLLKTNRRFDEPILQRGPLCFRRSPAALKILADPAPDTIRQFVPV
jgi:hypothetical protein